MARSNTSPLLDVHEGVFHKVPVSVQVFIVVAGVFAIAAWWDLYLHPLAFGEFLNRVAVIPLVGNQMLDTQAINELCSL